MARSEPNRNWIFGDAELNFPHRFLPGLHPTIGCDYLHCNRTVWPLLSESRPDVLLVAGGWANPTVWLSRMSSAPGRTIFWSESHLGSIRRSSLPVRMARQFALRRFKEFAVPGALAREYVEHHAGPRRIYELPNLVAPFWEEVGRRRNSARTRHKKSDDRSLLLIAARLIPEKGLLAFLEGLQRLSREERSKLTVKIAGAGSLLGDLARWIRSHDLDLRLLEHQDQEEMAELFLEADGFCLPSLSDPNPLAVIEALWTGLPVLLSSHVGNHPECLEERNNGFLFDPVNPDSVALAVSRWLALSSDELERFGNRSLQIAKSKFASGNVVRQFLDDVLADSSSEVQNGLAMAAALSQSRTSKRAEPRSSK